jgi:phosphomevalonate kinase
VPVHARAPGKLVLLGEYAVLDGAPALVMAVARYARARLAPLPDAGCRLSTRAPESQTARFDRGEATGVRLVDRVIAAAPELDWPGWAGYLDSSELFLGADKLGLGSSAAALVAWAGAWWRAASPGAQPPSAETLIQIHRAFQGGAGSGLDVAAARCGGVLRYRLDASGGPRIGSVRLPNSVGFAGIFAGSSASTTGLVARYDEWAKARPAEARALRAEMEELDEAGCERRRRFRAGDGRIRGMPGASGPRDGRGSGDARAWGDRKIG